MARSWGGQILGWRLQIFNYKCPLSTTYKALLVTCGSKYSVLIINEAQGMSKYCVLIINDAQGMSKYCVLIINEAQGMTTL